MVDPDSSLDPSPDGGADARRLAASLALARELQGVLVHEFGNPLQSVAVLVELAHDSLAARGPDEAGGVERETQRLAKALDATQRLRELIHRSSGLRTLLDGRKSGTWGDLLDQIVGLLGPRLERLRVTIERDTAAIDGFALAPGPRGEACLALVLDASEQIRSQRLGRTALVLGADAQSLRVGLRPEGGEPVAVAPEAIARAHALLGADASACSPEGSIATLRVAP